MSNEGSVCARCGGKVFDPVFPQTDDTALLRQCLEVMDKATRYMRDSDYRKLNETITTLRERLGEKK